MFFKKIHIRINIMFLFFLFIFLLILFKVFYIQVIDYKKLSKLSNDLWNRKLTIERDRGNNFDN